MARGVLALGVGRLLGHTVGVSAPWQAPHADRPVDAVISLPGSKSMTNRALVLAALGGRPTRLRDPLDARDTRLMAAALGELGVSVERTDTDWTVRPGALSGSCTVDVGNAGTVMRFLLPVAALADGPVHFDGDPRVRERPVAALVGALRALGADVAGDALPLTVCGRRGLPGGDVELNASQSSQFVSALLLVGCRFDKGLTVRPVGPPVPSQPHIQMTIAMLRAAGVPVDDSVRGQWSVPPAEPACAEWTIEPDLSNAAPFLAAAMVTGGAVRIPHWPLETTQPGAQLPALLLRMGAQLTLDGSGLALRAGPVLAGLDADLHEVGELAPVLAALCALASSPSRLHGIAHLRRHETDRLTALATELGRLGGEVRETGDGLVIWPAPLHGGLFRAYDDHRLATAAAVLGLVVPGVEVDDIATTGKTLPDFEQRWQQMLAGGVR